VYPRASVWKADVTIVLITEDGNGVIADRDVALLLSSHVGRLDPESLTIRAGEMSARSTLTSSQRGDETVSVFSTIGHASQPVQFGAPEVASLRVAPTPEEILNDGRAVVQVAVLLQAADGSITADSARDIKIHLDSDLGTFTDRDVTIPRGESSAETTFASPRYGKASITAGSVGLTGSGSVNFLFPWLMLILSIAGGASGSAVREGFGKGRRRRGSLPPFVHHLVMGAIFGLVFFGLAMFGAVGAIPKVDVGKIIPLNAIGAFLLGFIGGYLGNQFWAGDAKAKPDHP
jgi:hypothetical protein